MEPSLCAYCGEIVGVYEPIRVLLPGAGVLDGSLLKLEAELQAPGVMVVHERCYETFMHARDQGSAEPASCALSVQASGAGQSRIAAVALCNLSAACAGRRLVRKV